MEINAYVSHGELILYCIDFLSSFFLNTKTLTTLDDFARYGLEMKQDYPSIRRNFEWPSVAQRHLILLGDDISTLLHDTLVHAGSQPYPLLEPDYRVLEYFAQGNAYRVEEWTRNIFAAKKNSGIVAVVPDVTRVELRVLKPGVQSFFEHYSTKDRKDHKYNDQILIEMPKWIIGLTDFVNNWNAIAQDYAIRTEAVPDLITVPPLVREYRKRADLVLLHDATREPLPIKASNK